MWNADFYGIKRTGIFWMYSLRQGFRLLSMKVLATHPESHFSCAVQVMFWSQIFWSGNWSQIHCHKLLHCYIWQTNESDETSMLMINRRTFIYSVRQRRKQKEQHKQCLCNWQIETEKHTDLDIGGKSYRQTGRDSLVTTVPFPGVARSAWQEVSRPLVLHPLWEPQQHPGVIVSGAVSRTAPPKQHQQYNWIQNWIQIWTQNGIECIHKPYTLYLLFKKAYDLTFLGKVWKREEWFLSKRIWLFGLVLIMSLQSG